MGEVPRMRPLCARTNPVQGTPEWAPVKSLWFSAMAATALIAGPLTFSWSAALVSCGLTVATLCLGHSVGLHRLLIHRSFECPRWLEYVFVYLGVLVGMGGPRRMVYLHDIRDWSQRHAKCHRFFIHAAPIWQDWLWQMHYEIRLRRPPDFRPESRVTESRFYRFLDRTWMLQQAPVAAVLYAIGGPGWAIWGVCVRVAVSLTGHWFVGYIAHNRGEQAWIVEGAAVQGYNVRGLGWLTMGEAWHNNHHAFPGSARLGLRPGQGDLGWLALTFLEGVGLIRNLRLPQNLPPRPELRRVESQSDSWADAPAGPAATRPTPGPRGSDPPKSLAPIV